MSEQRGRQRSREQTLYGETSPQEPSSSPVRKSNPDVKRNKRIANGKLESFLRSGISMFVVLSVVFIYL